MVVREFDLNQEKLVCDVHHVDGSVYRGCDLVKLHSVSDTLFNFLFDNDLYCVPFSQIRKIIFHKIE